MFPDLDVVDPHSNEKLPFRERIQVQHRIALNTFRKIASEITNYQTLVKTAKTKPKKDYYKKKIKKSKNDLLEFGARIKALENIMKDHEIEPLDKKEEEKEEELPVKNPKTDSTAHYDNRY